MAHTWSLRNTMYRFLAVLLAAAVAIGAGALFSASSARASHTEVAGTGVQNVEDGTLTWGVHDEWRQYITGPIANGQIRAIKPATLGSDDRVTWQNGSGAVDRENGEGTITFQGGMQSQGHQGVGVPSDQFALDQTLSDIEIELTSPTTAKLTAEVDQPGASGFPEYSGKRVTMANLSFTHEALKSGSVTADAVFTEAGADVFARTNASYQPDKPMDQVQFSLDGNTAAPEPEEPQTQTNLSLEASSATVYQGEQVTLTATVSPQASGQVQFRYGDGTSLGAVRLSGGKAQLQTKQLPRGNHTIQAAFTPSDTGYQSSSGITSVSVVARGSNKESQERAGVEGSLDWGVKHSFRSYVVGGIANGKITASGGANQQRGNGSFHFPQASDGSNWNGSTGRIQYAGNVNFYGHDGVMDVTLSNPVIVVDSASAARLQTTFQGSTITVANIDLSQAKKDDLSGDAVRYNSAPVTLHSQGTRFFSHGSTEFYSAGEELDRMTFTVGDASSHDTASTPSTSAQGDSASADSEESSSTTPAATSGQGSAAGSLTWGVSDYFAAYTTEEAGSSSCPTPSGHCAGGTIETNGVGDGWVFPQATGGDWDDETHTGTVNFSGLVAFKGYGMTMFEVVNPSITVTDDSTATLHTGNSTSHGDSSYALDLSSGTKTENDDGSVTWSKVPVDGSLAGLNASQSIDLEPLTFTIGTANDASFGSGAAGSGGTEAPQYEAADTPPTTEGLEVLTDPDKIREGGRIKVRAEGFDAEDSGVLAVLYEDTDDTEPIVLDDTATADADGVVEWSGTLPDGATGEHVMTLQGSSDAGAEIDIKTAQATSATGANPEDIGVGERLMLAIGGMEPWEWWASAGSLLSIAGCSSLLTLRHRRNGQLLDLNT